MGIRGGGRHAGEGIMTADFEQQTTSGERFAFGRNWQRYLRVINMERIAQAERSLQDKLEVDSLKGKTFLDIGSGSGLFSLAAVRLGAARVHSMDYDPNSVACTQELKRRYFPNANNWTIERGNALDGAYLSELGQWDIVYSWGVLHHTGNMWLGLANAVPIVKSGGKLFISIYNDQAGTSRRWRLVKRLYNRSSLGRLLVLLAFIPYFVFGGLAMDILGGKNPMRRYSDYWKSRGMSIVHDWVDWLGGHPYEVAKPEAIFDFFRGRGFELQRLATTNGLGCNEYVFRRQ
jgi:2-polyprenyl-3-methyl-5-hydroxy-6-metoxy-1,4-benzoquinol methylase